MKYFDKLKTKNTIIDRIIIKNINDFDKVLAKMNWKKQRKENIYVLKNTSLFMKINKDQALIIDIWGQGILGTVTSKKVNVLGIFDKRYIEKKILELLNEIKKQNPNVDIKRDETEIKSIPQELIFLALILCSVLLSIVMFLI